MTWFLRRLDKIPSIKSGVGVRDPGLGTHNVKINFTNNVKGVYKILI